MSNLGEGIFEQGEKQGKKEGVELGKEEEKNTILKRMLQRGMDEATIIDLLQVTSEQIAEAKKDR